MTAAPDATLPEWARSFVPLGACGEREWTPLGSGVLLVESPTVWLVTTRSLLDEAGEAPVAAWVSQAEGGTVLDLTGGLERSGLDWVRDPERDLAISLFPIDPAWGLKAFPVARCLGLRDLRLAQPLLALGTPYALGGAPPTRPTPAVLDGIVSALDPEAGTFLTTAPLLPRNVGAPLIAMLPGAPGAAGPDVALAGVLIRSSFVPDDAAPPVRLATALPGRAVVELIQSEEARAQRRRVLEESGSQ